MARLTRIAVILSLIVATTMQPALAYTVQRDCSADGMFEFDCQGCGCCEVKTPSAKCTCCRGSNAEEHGHVGCCGHSSQREQAPIEPVGIGNHSFIKSSVLEPNLSSACTCFTNPKPLDAPAPRSPIDVEIRDLASSDTAFCVATPIPQERQEASRLGNASHVDAAHFVQIAFCVWRL